MSSFDLHGVSQDRARPAKRAAPESGITRDTRQKFGQITIRMGLDIIEHFKRMAEETGIPYQNLINL